MIPYGTLSLVGVHAYWIAPVYLRAGAPIARRSLRRSLKRMRRSCRCPPVPGGSAFAPARA